MIEWLEGSPMFDGLKKRLAERHGTVPETSLGLGRPAAAPTNGFSRLRDSLFADAKLNELLEALSAEAKLKPPFSIFAQAAEAVGAGDRDKAVAILKILTVGQEPRLELLAWTALGELGAVPSPERAKEVLGVIVEVAMDGGEDLVVAFADRRARYYNYSGAGVIWETDDSRLNPQIDALLEAGRKVVAVIGPWKEKRPDMPRANRVRLNMLTPSGLHFGEGDMNALSRDPMGGPVIKLAFGLMKALIAVDAEFRRKQTGT